MTVHTVQRGDRGELVINVQKALNKVGAMLISDGDFGRGTEKGVCYAQDMAGLPVTGLCDGPLLHWLSEQPEPYANLDTEGVAMIAREETGGLAYYDMVCRCPHYPGYESGITIGVGYDLRFNTEASLRRLWQPYLSAKVITELLQDIGKRGTKKRAAELKDLGIEVPFKSAWPVFIEQLLPQYYQLTESAFNELALLPKLCRAVLVSIVFNRGASFRGSSRLEMRAIRNKLKEAFLTSTSENQQKHILLSIEEDILDMRRLWNAGSGLVKRRQVEANYWRQSCLDASF